MSYEIVCPDGHVRHYPYTQALDAEFDARFIDREGKCQLYKIPNELEARLPACDKQRPHTVRPVAVTAGDA